MMFFYRPWLLAGAFLAIAFECNAQAPQRTTATYEDWTVRCEMMLGPPAQKTCEMVQTTTLQGQPNLVTLIAIGRATKADPIKIVFQVPVNLWLAGGVSLVYDEKQPGLSAAFLRCLPVGCFAEATLADDAVKKLRARRRRGGLNSRMPPSAT